MKLKTIIITMVSLISLLNITACVYNDAVTLYEEEFIFSPEDIEGYQEWTIIDYSDRPDINQWRTIYINKPEEADRTEGSYPLGTILVKEGRSYSDRTKVVSLQVMAKRGGTFNPLGNYWEWAYTASGDIHALNDYRGDNSLTLNGNTCISCHQGYNDLVVKQYK
ncbi:cytochrome P460 family protein [Algivirga pacifica]|uniref:Cytochrome P460 domain-containing protein n=1 Tax=Algivirga pacifica TaxID=1162670 RepID=A0ABP9D4N4_9BACT